MKQEFKVGDKVYYPSKSTKVHALHERDEEGYALFFNHNNHVCSFKSNGIEWSDEIMPTIFHATPENHELLCKLYGVEFEAPPKRKTPKEVIQAMLNSGWIGVTCYVSDDNKRPSKHDKKSLITSINETRKFPFCGGGCWWLYATPFDLSTGKIIIDYIDGEIVTE